MDLVELRDDVLVMIKEMFFQWNRAGCDISGYGMKVDAYKIKVKPGRLSKLQRRMFCMKNDADKAKPH